MTHGQPTGNKRGRYLGCTREQLSLRDRSDGPPDVYVGPVEWYGDGGGASGYAPTGQRPDSTDKPPRD